MRIVGPLLHKIIGAFEGIVVVITAKHCRPHTMHGKGYHGSALEDASVGPFLLLDVVQRVAGLAESHSGSACRWREAITIGHRLFLSHACQAA